MAVYDTAGDEGGKVYLIPYNYGIYVVAQVGRGGDLGVFSGLHDRSVSFDLLEDPLLFRVNYDQSSPDTHGWSDLGRHPYKAGLADFQPYFHKPAGAAECLLKYLDGRELPVDCAKQSDFEAPETRSHEDIVSRYRLMAQSKR